MNNYGNNWWSSMPPVTKNLILINLLIWLVEILIPSFGKTLMRVLALHYVDSNLFNPVQILTYMFMHDPKTPWHILFNMFTLWMFGRVLEQVWGSRRFLMFYLICGVGAALVQEAVWGLSWKYEYIDYVARLNGLTFEHAKIAVDQRILNNDPAIIEAVKSMKASMLTIGASGAVYGLLLGFGFVFPNMPLYFFFIPIPIKAKWMVIGYGVIEFFLGIAGGGTIAHFAHLGGMLFGLIILLYWHKRGTLRGNRF